MRVEDNLFKMTLSGTPQLEVIDVVDNTNIPFSETLLTGFLDLVTMFALPQLTDKFMEIDVPDIDQALLEQLMAGNDNEDDEDGFTLEGSVETTTQFIEANNGKHLSFGMGLNRIDN